MLASDGSQWLIPPRPDRARGSVAFSVGATTAIFAAATAAMRRIPDWPEPTHTEVIPPVVIGLGPPAAPKPTPARATSPNSPSRPERATPTAIGNPGLTASTPAVDAQAPPPPSHDSSVTNRPAGPTIPLGIAPKDLSTEPMILRGGARTDYVYSLNIQHRSKPSRWATATRWRVYDYANRNVRTKDE